MLQGADGSAPASQPVRQRQHDYFNVQYQIIIHNSIYSIFDEMKFEKDAAMEKRFGIRGKQREKEREKKRKKKEIEREIDRKRDR